MTTGPTQAKLQWDEMPTLLVVDDDVDILRVVRFYLSKQKYRVHTAESGEEALELLERLDDVELVLSDVMMPRMSGLELLETLRADDRYADIPVILISAEGETSKKVVGLNLGADDFITKPFNFDELMARVRNHIRLHRLQKEVMIASRQVLHANEQLQDQNDRFLADLDAARGVQQALLPETLPDDGQVRVAARYQPAERIGGDLFDVRPLNDGSQLGIMVADVCGHGVKAAFITAMTKVSFQNASYASLDPAVVLNRMNRELNANLHGDYVTVFYAVYDIATRRLDYASGGHPPLLLHRPKENRVLELEPQATFLGCFDPVDFETESVVLEPGDRVYFYTDGLFESHDPGGAQYGLERVVAYMREELRQPIDGLLEGLVHDLMVFVQGVPIEDDITIVGLEVCGGAEPNGQD